MKKLQLSQLATRAYFPLVLSCLGFACSQVDSTASLPSVYGGGQVAPASWSNVVAITERQGGLFCSGTALTPNLVITAAHCVQGLSPSDATVYVGEGQEGGTFAGQYQIAQLAASPLYDYKSGEGHDIAYLVLRNPLRLPQSAFVPLLTDPEEMSELLAVGSIGHIVGFGNRDDGGFGVKFEVDAPVTAVDAIEVYLGGDGKDSCQGDSGGPVFGKLADGSWRFYGVTSRGGDCGTGGIYGLAAADICWVQEDSGQALELPAGFCATTGETGAGENEVKDEVKNEFDNDFENEIENELANL